MHGHLACSCYSHLRREILLNDFYVSSSIECLGIHLGGPQSANLGDGNGSVNQTVRLFLCLQIPYVSNSVCVDGTEGGLWGYSDWDMFRELDWW
jgi:hypothetical protein